jgi:hypothetical protein
MMSDAPELDFSQPFRFHGQLVVATEWSFTHGCNGGTFELRGVLMHEEPDYVDAAATAAPEREAIAAPPLTLPAVIIEPEPAVSADVVTFHVRSIRYGCDERSEDYSTIEEAIGNAMWQFDYGWSCDQEVWCGDERVLDLDGILDRD